MSSKDEIKSAVRESITFTVDRVAQAPINKNDYTTVSDVSDRFYRARRGDKLEACGVKADGKNWLKSYGGHSFFKAAIYAFQSHYPLVLSPDHIFQLILEGWASHVDANADALRSAFVQHEVRRLSKSRRIILSRVGIIPGQNYSMTLPNKSRQIPALNYTPRSMKASSRPRMRLP